MTPFPLRLEIWPEDGWWIAQSPELEVATQGHTPEEAFHNIQEALELFVESCFRRGTLDEVMADCGIPPDKAQQIRSKKEKSQ